MADFVVKILPFTDSQSIELTFNDGDLVLLHASTLKVKKSVGGQLVYLYDYSDSQSKVKPSYEPDVYPCNFNVITSPSTVDVDFLYVAIRDMIGALNVSGNFGYDINSNTIVSGVTGAVNASSTVAMSNAITLANADIVAKAATGHFLINMSHAVIPNTALGTFIVSITLLYSKP